MKGRARAPPRPPHPDPIHRGGRGTAAPVGRRDITRATTEAAGGGEDPPPTTTTTPADGGRVAAAAGLPPARADGAGTSGLDGVDLRSGPTPLFSALGPGRARPGAMGPAAVLDNWTAARTADTVYDSTDD